MTKDNIQVDLTDDSFVIQGERKQEQKEEREGYAYSECSYGRFYRPFRCRRALIPRRRQPSSATECSKSPCRNLSGRRRKPDVWRFRRRSAPFSNIPKGLSEWE